MSWFLGSKILGRLGSLVPEVLVPGGLGLWFRSVVPERRVDRLTLNRVLGLLVPQSWIVLVLWFHDPGSSWFSGSMTAAEPQTGVQSNTARFPNAFFSSNRT